MIKTLFTEVPPVRRMLRFASVGVFCTVLSLTLNFVLLKFARTPLIPTYVAVYAMTILVSFVMNSRFTFDTHITVSNGAVYFAIYLTSMGLGVILLSIFRRMFNFENWVYPFMTVPFTMLWNYFLSARLLKKKKP